jgi:DNA (cytosine-5)-methyltransferase 1
MRKRVGWDGQFRLFGEAVPERNQPRIVDYFAGGGGVSHAIERALGRSPDVAINHSEAAIAMHRANHPNTKHFCMDVWDLDPEKHLPPGWLAFAWGSPSCVFFSRARGSAPVNEQERGDANVMLRLARARRQAVTIIENVPEFVDWGPVGEDGKPIREQKGLYFRDFVQAWRDLGAQVEWRILDAADFGAPTHRKRMFMICRLDGLPIVWPEPTHGPGREHPWVPASSCIDFSLPMLSIFATREEARVWAKANGTGIPQRPLAEATMRRIAEGIRRFVLEADRPFIVQTGGWPVAPTLIQTGYGERKGQAPRVLDLHAPLGTIVGCGQKHALVAAFLQKHNGKTVGQSVERPIGTLVATNNKSVVAAHLTKFHGEVDGRVRAGQSLDAPLHTIDTNPRFGLVAAFLTKWYQDEANGQSLSEPLHTIVTKARFGLVMVHIGGVPYALADISLRMLSPRELARCQGFSDDYKLTGSLAEQVKRVGNSVSPPVAEALIRENVAPLFAPRRVPEAAE